MILQILLELHFQGLIVYIYMLNYRFTYITLLEMSEVLHLFSLLLYLAFTLINHYINNYYYYYIKQSIYIVEKCIAIQVVLGQNFYLRLRRQAHSIYTSKYHNNIFPTHFLTLYMFIPYIIYS